MDQSGKIRSRYAGHALLGPLVETYVKELPAVAAELAQAMAQRERREVARLSHRLSGDAATYGFAELSAAAKCVEQAATAQTSEITWAEVEAAYQPLALLFDRVEA